MRVMVLVKATEDSEKGFSPTAETMAMMEAMGRFNDELSAAGILLAGDGLKPSSQGKRVAFDGSRRTVVDGPFAHPSELVAGFWLWDVKDLDEAVAWVSAALIPCRDRAKLKSGRSTSWPISDWQRRPEVA